MNGQTNMFDLWWNNKCRRYAQKLDHELDMNPRSCKSHTQMASVLQGLIKASKSMVDGYAHEYLVDLDRRLDAGEFTPTVTKKIRKAIT